MQKNTMTKEDRQSKELSSCKICGKSFSSIKGNHLHISKAHKISLKEYYKKYYKKQSFFSGKAIPFKNVNQYFSTDFLNREELISWCLSEKPEITSVYIKKLLIDRKKEKQLKYSLSHIELELCKLPNIDCYTKIFGSYSKICKEIGLKNILNKNLPSDFFSFESDSNSPREDMKIFVDTREQKPINFLNSECMKLDFGDYTSAAPYYDYTYIDRKSEGDFKSTLSGSNYDRFKRELDRTRKFNSYIFVLIESDIHKITKNNIFSPHRSKLPYIWHNLKTISQDYKDCCQFVFASNRNGLKKLIPQILLYGKRLWNVDLQYFLDIKINEKRKNHLVS